MIDGGDGGSIMFGDAFTVTGDLNYNFSPFFSSPSLENAIGLLNQGLKFETSIGLPGDGTNTNTIKGGSGFDLVFGSKGNDTISGRCCGRSSWV